MVIHVFHEILRILISLVCGSLKPHSSSSEVFGRVLSKQINFTEGILRVLIALFCRFREPADSILGIFGNFVSLEEELAQVILCRGVPTLRRLPQSFQFVR